MNGQVERANGMVLQGIKPRFFNKLNKFGGQWVAELPTVLWRLRMTPQLGDWLHTFRHGLRCQSGPPTDLDYGALRIMA
jgi:hypothetical protein